MVNFMVRLVCAGLVILCLLGLWGCHGGQAPREFAPNGSVIQRAMELQLSEHYRDFSRAIAAHPPIVEVKNISVKQLDSFFLQQLPVYHVVGTYDVAIAFEHRTEQRPHNPFELYLQRQREGKTWRSLIQDHNHWRSYPIPPE